MNIGGLPQSNGICENFDGTIVHYILYLQYIEKKVAPKNKGYLVIIFPSS